MKQFNVEEYLKNPSKKVIARDGRNVTIHCTNCVGSQPVVAEIEGEEHSTHFSKDGTFLSYSSTPSANDLFFAPEKHEGWVNVFEDVISSSYVGSHIFKTKEDAKKVVKNYDDYKTTAKIEWEE